MKKHLFTRLCAGLLLTGLTGTAVCADHPPLPQEKGLTLLFAGDIVPDGIPGNMMKKGRDPLRGVSDILTSTDLRIGNLDKMPIGTNINEFLSSDGQLSLQNMDSNPDRNLVLGFSFKGNTSAHNCIVLKRHDQLMIVAQDTVQPDLGTMADMGKINNEMATLTRELSEKKTALENAYAKISELISTDYLTGLASRKYIHESFVKAVSFAKRTATPLTIIMADLDYFKQVNDHCGHPVGDAVLKQTSQIIGRLLRKSDLLMC